MHATKLLRGITSTNTVDTFLSFRAQVDENPVAKNASCNFAWKSQPAQLDSCILIDLISKDALLKINTNSLYLQPGNRRARRERSRKRLCRIETVTGAA